MMELTTVFFFFMFFLNSGESLDCYQCESSNENACREFGPDLLEKLCDAGENVCLSFGIKNPYNEDRPRTYVRKCAVDGTICGKVKNIHGNNVLQCTTCEFEKCNKNIIG
ncbi:uncharacterized protein LOC123315613 [Coccinella septempunctata]|uniref:uncharacterized protein LOC123315613 n=1 Tax=Coccinella septempunctata TaxID=41139 RepID=UPI001D08B00A|nr:uncharacterized protein LOC123315613 [Coccinella septempunctata]